jgi:aspartate aminotransferase
MRDKLAGRMHRIKPSATFAAGAKAKALAAEGRDIIDLTLGEPDFDTPDYIKAAGIAAIQGGQTKYTAIDGTPALKKAIAEKFRAQNGLDYKPEEITVGTGGKQVLFNALMATVDEGDEVIIPAPYWVSYPDIVQLAGGTPVHIEASAQSGFKITAAQLRAAVTPKTKWLIINSPSNPCGAAYTAAELSALADELKNHPHVMVLSDDLYEHIVYDDFKFATLAALAPELKDRTLTLNGVSKAYAMTGWRIGYAGGPKWLIDAIRVLQSQSTSNPCSVSQAAAVAALSGDHAIIRARTAEFQTRRDAVAGWLNAIPGIQCRVPEGAFYLFPSIEKFIGARTPDGKTLADDTDVTMYLLEHAGVAAVMGSAFGMPGFIRLSYATSLDKLKAA